MDKKTSILEELEGLAEENYKTFNKKIIPTKQTTLGVRIPVLRKIAKRIVKENGVEFVQQDKNNVYEMIMLEGMVLSYMDKPFQELLPSIEAFLLKVDNWAQVDSTICDFKNIRKEKDEVLTVVTKWLESDEEFTARAALIILLAHFVDKDHLQLLFEISQKVEHQGYYVHMANAWLISCCMAKHPEETILFFKENSLDKKTHNKAIQKSRESFRVSTEHKKIINNLKRK